ncbi:MAG: hypothetical protein QOG35_1912 [Solirubrobacteraceae bacterium]|nr:hypothetical protein [Solirubrobacteraceae bacterium]
MTEPLLRSARRRRGREARFLTAGVLVCGAVLLPATSAFAEDMPAMKDGMMCPHAVGDASNPATTAPPTRSAPNEAPLGAKPASVVTPPSPGRAATKPGSQAPAERAAATQPASAPATTTAKSTAGAGAAVRATQPQRATAPVPQPQRAATPVAQRPAVAAPAAAPSHTAASGPNRSTSPKHSAPARHVSPPAATPPVIPEVTRPSAGTAPKLTTAPAGALPAGVLWVAIGGGLVLLLIASAAALAVLRRRRGGGAALTAAVPEPLEPSLLPLERTEIDEVEIALREMLSEARAKELLGQVDVDSDTDLVAR